MNRPRKQMSVADLQAAITARKTRATERADYGSGKPQAGRAQKSAEKQAATIGEKEGTEETAESPPKENRQDTTASDDEALVPWRIRQFINLQDEEEDEEARGECKRRRLNLRKEIHSKVDPAPGAKPPVPQSVRPSGEGSGLTPQQGKRKGHRPIPSNTKGRESTRLSYTAGQGRATGAHPAGHEAYNRGARPW